MTSEVIKLYRVRTPDGKYIEHEEDGVVFSRVVEFLDNTNEVAVETYCRIDNIGPCLDAIREGVETGEWPDTGWFALVRHGEPSKGECGYYPLPLVFSTPEEREEAAKALGKRPPAQRFITRARSKVLDLLGITNQ